MKEVLISLFFQNYLVSCLVGFIRCVKCRAPIVPLVLSKLLQPISIFFERGTYAVVHCIQGKQKKEST